MSDCPATSTNQLPCSPPAPAAERKKHPDSARDNWPRRRRFLSCLPRTGSHDGMALARPLESRAGIGPRRHLGTCNVGTMLPVQGSAGNMSGTRGRETRPRVVGESRAARQKRGFCGTGPCSRRRGRAGWRLTWDGVPQHQILPNVGEPKISRLLTSDSGLSPAILSIDSNPTQQAGTEQLRERMSGPCALQ